MKWVNYVMIALMLSLFVACSDDSEADPTGLRVSQWYKSEQYGKDIIDIINFDDYERKVRVSTLCFDENNISLETNDTEELTIPAESQWTWVPVCPKNTKSYTIDLVELE